MIITRTPFRISFFGGGTDYPAWFREHGGAVLATTINKYCYIHCRELPPFFDHKSRVVWSRIELVKKHAEIEHPAVREALAYLDITDGIELHHDGDLPARTGIGSSSSFTVGLLHALYAYRGQMVSKRDLARAAIHLEQERLRETVGCQDQIVAAYGGLNRIDFTTNGDFRVAPVMMSPDRLVALRQNLMLVFTGISRTASAIAAEQVRVTPHRLGPLKRIQEMVEEGTAQLGAGDLAPFGRLLHESWLLKRSLTPLVSTPEIDAVYDAARSAGALGGKLLGAGGGGFMLLFVPPDRRGDVGARLRGLLEVPFEFERAGSEVIFHG